MELRSRRKLSSDLVVNVRYKSSSSSDDDDGDKDDSLLGSDDTLERDGEFESDEDSDEKAIEPGRLGDTVEGLQPLPSAEPDNDNIGLPVEDETGEISNAPPAPPTKKRKFKQPKLIWEILREEDAKWIAKTRDNATILKNFDFRINETAVPSRDLTMPLLKYQKEWLAWALKQETSEARGGILADEMGMGKTIQAIALVLAKREQSQPTSQFTISSLPGQSSTGLPEVRGTLIICPAATLTQWENEIKRFTATGTVKVLVYHGDRRTSLDLLTEYDFILTTYAMVEKQYEGKPCTDCRRLHNEPMMPEHMKNFCPQNPSIHSEEVSPVSNSSRKLSKSLKGASNIKHKSSKRKCTSSPIKSKRELKLHFVKWQRIILDEAHFIKNKIGRTANAVFSLDASFRWALTGTPFQNSLEELYSLIKFLRVDPYPYHFCVLCDCKLHYRCPYRSCEISSCKSCSHHSYNHFSWWKKYVEKPIRRKGYTRAGKDAVILLKNKLLKGIMLRRTKKGRAAELALPPRIISLRQDSMDVKERDYYNSICRANNREYNRCFRDGKLIAFRHEPQLFIHLRQAANHPYLVLYSKPAVAVETHTGCFICSDIAEEAVAPDNCEHVFCKTCFTGYKCPICSIPLTAGVKSLKSKNVKTSLKGYGANSILQRINLEDFQTSTKIDALKEEIRFMLERDGSAKGVVFSQFNPFLDLISYALKKGGISSVLHFGSMAARNAAVKKFKEDGECRIFLASLETEGHDLNLEVASHVFLMEPSWNPAKEQRAIARIHRRGQYKPTRVVRFVIENSFEKYILKFQKERVAFFERIFGE